MRIPQPGSLILAGVLTVALGVVAGCTGGGESPAPAETATASAATPTAQPTTSTATPAPALPVPTTSTTPAPTVTPMPTAAPPTPTATAAAAPAPTVTPTPTASTPLTLHYDSYDLTGAVERAGSYAFLGSEGGSGVVTTYEGLRDGTATLLRIHGTDADGISQVETLGQVVAGQIIEWRQADDCFVRYTVGGVTAGASSWDLAVEWMTYAFTGCSGAVDADAQVSIRFGALPDLGGASLTAPVVHGVYQIVPVGWTGATKPSVRSERSTSYPLDASTTDVAVARTMRYWRDPAVPAGWAFLGAETGGGEIQAMDGYCAAWVTETGDPGFDVCGEKGTRYWFSAGEASWHDGASRFETRVVAGRPASVIYGVGDPYFPLSLRVYDPATDVEYTIRGKHRSVRGWQVDAVIAIAEGMFGEQPASPSAAPASGQQCEAGSATLCYDSYDLTGAVERAGSYAFLGGEGGSGVVATYEGLRDGTATLLRIHGTDADGISQAETLGHVVAGQIIEWHQADDCFVRYTVGGVTAGASSWDLVVGWMTYAFTGCSGPVDANAPVTFTVGPLPDLGGPSLTTPAVHGVYQIAPRGWAGAIEPEEVHEPPRSTYAYEIETSDITLARELIDWREPNLPRDWIFGHTYSGGYGGAHYGYCAVYLTEERLYRASRAR